MQSTYFIQTQQLDNSARIGDNGFAAIRPGTGGEAACRCAVECPFSFRRSVLFHKLPILPVLLFAVLPGVTQEKAKSKPPDLWTTADFGALKLRSIGPAQTAGRVVG